MSACEKCGEVHADANGRPMCSAHSSRSGKRCKKYPVDGASVCENHGGRAPQVKAKAAAAVQAVEVAKLCDRLGQSRDIGHVEGLLELVAEAAGNVEFYRQLVTELPIHPEPDTAEVGEDGEPHYTRGEPGIYGRTYHVSGIPTGEAKPHILVTMYNDERDRWSKLCLDMARVGIDERRMRLAEVETKRLFGAFGKALSAADLTPEQIEVVRREFAANLRAEDPPFAR